jgi:hypothetical protein
VTGKQVLKKRLRIVLDFEVEAHELTEEALHDYYRQFESYAEMVADTRLWGNLCRQVRLQRVLLDDEQVLNRYLAFLVADEVDGSSNSGLAEVFGVGGKTPEEDIFSPLFSRLNEEDAGYYREVSEAQMLFEAMEELSRSFTVMWVSTTLEDVNTLVKNRMYEAKSRKHS